MLNKHLSITKLVMVLGLVGVMGGCATQGANKPVASVAEEQLFMTYNENNQIVVLGDSKLQEVLMQTNAVELTRTRTGGPDGRTLIFGMNKDEAKLGGPTRAENMYDRKLVPDAAIYGYDSNLEQVVGFYGQVYKDGRYFVFINWKDMADYLKHGEVTLTFTDIGNGPKGETVIYALNKETAKKGKPVAAMERFKKQHALVAK